MRFFNLVQQDDRIRFAPDGFGQHAAFAVADVSRRRALEARNGVGFLIFAHIDRDQISFAAVERFGKSKCRLGFTDARCSDQQKDADRAFRIGQPGTRCADSLRDRFERVVLAEDSFAERFVQASARH